MNRFLNLAASFGLLWSVSACGSSSTDLQTGDLTDAEIQAVFDALAVTFSLVSPGDTGPDTGRETLAITIPLAGSAPCPKGGSVVASGEVDVSGDPDTQETNWTLTLTPTACVVSTDASDVTVNGEPSITFTLNWLADSGGYDLTGAHSGGLAFVTSDGRTGSCSLDLTFAVRTDLAGTVTSSSASGSVCGRSAEGFNAFAL